MANMEPLVRGGQDYHHDVFKEVLKALVGAATVSVIPEGDHGTMESHIKEFFKISQARWESRVRNRQLFDGVQVLIGDFPTPPPGRIDQPE
jgi:hypothetical protein